MRNRSFQVVIDSNLRLYRARLLAKEIDITTRKQHYSRSSYHHRCSAVVAVLVRWLAMTSYFRMSSLDFGFHKPRGRRGSRPAATSHQHQPPAAEINK